MKSCRQIPVRAGVQEAVLDTEDPAEGLIDRAPRIVGTGTFPIKTLLPTLFARAGAQKFPQDQIVSSSDRQILWSPAHTKKWQDAKDINGIQRCSHPLRPVARGLYKAGLNLPPEVSIILSLTCLPYLILHKS